MKINWFIVLAVTATALFCSCAGTGSPVKEYDPDLLRKDFLQFRSIIENKTAGLYADKKELSMMLDEAEARIDGRMPEEEFLRLLAPIVSALRCGHSFLSVSEATENFMNEQARFFPLEVRIIDGRLYVISDPYYRTVAPGSEIKSINNDSAKYVIDAITSNMPTDGTDEGRPRYDAERWFASMYYYYIGRPEAFSLELVNAGDGEEYSLSLQAVHDPALVKTGMGVVHDTANTPYRLQLTEDYALATIPTFAYSDTRRFRNDLKTFFTAVRERKIQTLVVDLRGNYGGSSRPTVELFKYLINKPLPFYAEENPFYLNKWKKPVEPYPEAFTGELYVLMDEAGFSMNGFLLSLLKYHNIGLLYGAESSGGYMCSDASVNAVLKNTGLRLRYSTQVFSSAVEGFPSGKGIEPDIRVEWTVSDYISGHDPVMEAVLENAAAGD